jgi:hypothetical protein
MIVAHFSLKIVIDDGFAGKGEDGDSDTTMGFFRCGTVSSNPPLWETEVGPLRRYTL